jgi:coenzyme Q-binding protein COQ10
LAVGHFLPQRQDASAEREMPVFRAMRRIHHSAEEMFDLVADVERYREFVPLCLKHAIRSRATRAGTEILMTNMTVACGIYRESFISRVTLDRANGCILVESTDGPLRRLQTRWTFSPRSDDSCDVGFYLHYELASRTLALLMGAVFDAAFGRFVEAFERRADVVYARPRAACRSARSSAARSASVHKKSCSRSPDIETVPL